MSMHRNIRLLALHSFLTDFHFYSALLIIYFAQVTSSYALAMSLFAVAMVSSALFEIPTGVFSDFIGRKRTVIAGSVCATFAVVFYAIGTHYWILFIGAIFEGLQRAWYSGNNDALLYESLTDRTRYEISAGKVRSMVQFAAAIAIIIGGFMASSFSLIMWASVLPQLGCIVIACLLTEPKRIKTESTSIYTHIKSSAMQVWKNPKLRLLSLSSMISFSIGESTYQFRSAFVSSLWPIWAVGISKILSSLGAGVGFWFSGKAIQKVGPYKILLVTDLYGRIVNMVSVVFATVFSPILLATTALFYGVNEMSKSKLMQDEYTDTERATLGSVTSFASNFAFGLAAIMLGMVADKWGTQTALIVAYLVSLPNSLIKWHLFRKHEART